MQLWAGIAVPIGERYRQLSSDQFPLPSDIGVYNVVGARGLRERNVGDGSGAFGGMLPF